MLRLIKYFCLLIIFVKASFGAGEKISTTQQDPKCLLPMEPGPCRMNLERYYYNAKTNSCETFKFGGCRGNDNKFGFLKTCEDACLKPARSMTDSRASTAAMITSKTSTLRPIQTNTPKPTNAVKNINKT